MVEHLTFNQVVRGSNPRCLIVFEEAANRFLCRFAVFCFLIQAGDLSYAVLFLVLMLIYSNITRKRYIKIFGIILLFVYMLLLMIEYSYISAGKPIPYGIPLYKSESVMAFSGIYSFLIFGIGYIIIGILIKKRIDITKS